MEQTTESRTWRAIEGIRRMISTPELLCGLAEEAAELTQAAAKYRRTIVPGNPTPVSKDEAWAKLLEEFGDVLLCMQVLDIDASSFNAVMSSVEKKADRWLKRLQEDEHKLHNEGRTAGISQEAQRAINHRDAQIAIQKAQLASLIIQNKTLKDKAAYFDHLVEQNTMFTLCSASKKIGAPMKKLIDFLLEHKYLCRDQFGELQPCANLNDGLFEVREYFDKETGCSGDRVLITTKGCETFRLLYQGLK